MRHIAREGLVLAAAQGASALGRLVTVFFLTRLLAPESYGTMVLLQGIATLGLSLAPAPLLQAMLRFHTEAALAGTAQDLRRVLKPRILRIAWGTVAVFLLGTLVWLKLCDPSWGGAAIVAAIAAMIIVVPDCSRSYELNVLNARREPSSLAVWTAVDALVRPAGAVAAIALAGSSAASALVGTLVVVVLANSLCARALVRERAETSPRGDAWMRAAWPRMLRFAIPLAPLAVFVWIVGLADRYVLATLFGREAAGLYAAAYGLASQPFIALGFVGLTFVRPRFFAAIDAGDLRRARRVLVAVVLGTAVCAALGDLVLALFATPITQILFGPRFHSTAPLLGWIGAAFAFQSVQMVLEVLVYARHRTGRLLVIQAASAAAAITLYVLLIPRWSARGAALATLGACAVCCVLTMVLGDLAGLLRLAPAWARPTGDRTDA